jgi:DNA-binding transcriptional LysR family regulator
MDLRALRYFIEVVRQNGFTRAAETLHVTQPTISKMVKALEDEFGGRLLLREGRGVQLTDAGQVVYDRGLEILEQAQLLRRQVAEVDHITRGELSLGIMPTTGHYMAPVIALFQQRYPGVNLQVNEQGARAQYQLIQEGKLDMALGLFAAPDPALERYTVARQKTRVVLPAQQVQTRASPCAGAICATCRLCSTPRTLRCTSMCCSNARRRASRHRSSCRRATGIS